MENRDAYYNFLEDLRKSGETNMYGATIWLEGEEPEESSLHLSDYNLATLDHAEAKELLLDWMNKYNELSRRFDWDKSMTPEEGELPEEDTDNYRKLFDEDIDKNLIDNFLKALANQELMNELDNAKHIWYIEGLPFIVSYEDDEGKLFSLVNDKVTVYDKWLDEYCNDFDLDYEEVKEQIKNKTGIDFGQTSDTIDFDEDDVEPVDYGSEEVVEDEFEEEGE